MLYETNGQLRPSDLYQVLLASDPLFVLDVRNRKDFESWQIKGRTTPATLNVPYFEILERGGKDDMVESVIEYATQYLAHVLPRDTPILTVCAKGDTSAYVADALRRMSYRAVNLVGGTKAWGDFYDLRPVVQLQSFSIYQISRPARGCLSYIVAGNCVAAVIDPLRHTNVYIEVTRDKQLSIAKVLDTHAHADHISGGPSLSADLKIPYCLHPYDAIHPVDVYPGNISFQFVQDGDVSLVEDIQIKAIHIPGHTLGNLAYLVNEKYLISGDSIFINSIARPDLGGKADTWTPLHYRSINKLLSLPEETVILPGHFSNLSEADQNGIFAAQLSSLKAANEGLRMAMLSENAFTEYILASLPTFPPQYLDIKRVNLGLLQVNEEKSSELELGPNICALSQAYIVQEEPVSEPTF